jgi:PAS domain S-box-containing protein
VKSAEEIIARIHPEDEQRVLKAIADALDPVDPKCAVTLFRLRERHGEIRWVVTLGQGYFEGVGSARRGVSIVGTCQDMTARKEREEKEQLLIGEIYHSRSGR